MSLKLIVDSACDIPRVELVDAGVGFLPLRVTMGGREYNDGVDLSTEEFYRLLADEGDRPSTSQITPGFYEEAFKRALAKDDEVVCITISAGLSGTCESALAAVEMLPLLQRRRVHVVDSENVSIGEQVLVRLAVQLAAEGLSAGELAEELDRRKQDIRLYALLDTLEYLKRGGRVSGVAAAAGALLNVKPLVAVENGVVVSAGKARGVKAGRSQLAKHVREAGGINETLPYVVGYSGVDDASAREFAQANIELLGSHPSMSAIGSTIGSHVGPGAIGVAFFCS